MPLDPSSAISSLKWIGSLAIEEGKYLYQVPQKVRIFLQELQSMVLLLHAVDGQGGNLDNQVHDFSIQIRELAFRSEDIIDTYYLKYRHNIEDRNFLVKFACLFRNSYQIHKIGTQIESIHKEVLATNERLQIFRAVVLQNMGPSSSINFERLRDAPGRALLRGDEFVVGIENDIKTLVTRISHSARSELSFFAIVGTGGAGKTTLAKKIYDHSSIKQRFDTKAMISISQEWDDTSLLAEIIRQSMGETVEQRSIKLALVEMLQKFLHDKRYLIVFDDIWHTSAWDKISGAFPNNYGSVVVVTTRIGDIPSHIHRSCYVHNPNPLGEEDKYKLIHKNAIEGREAGTSTIKKFEDLGREMAKKCSGTPLAVVSLSGILRTKDHLYEWEQIKNALPTNVLNGKGTGEYGIVKDMLCLSYDDLPPNLRPCFLYLAIYPEDDNIDTEILVRLWIAEGFVTNADCQPREMLENVGTRFLDEMNKRCLLISIERNYEGKMETFKIHDLVHDFCIEKAKEQSFLKLVSALDHGYTRDPSDNTQARRIVFHQREQDVQESQEHVINVLECEATSSLRSLIQFGLGDENMYHLSRPDVQPFGSIHKKFKLLKILYVSRVQNMSVPEAIGTLINLSYFGVRNCKLGDVSFFKSLKNLINLLTFDFQGTRLGLDMFDRDLIIGINNIFGKMEKLRYVCLPNIKWADTTLGLATSKNLQVLIYKRYVYAREECHLIDLAELKSLRELYVMVYDARDIDLVYRCPSLTCLQFLTLDGVVGVRELLIDLQNLKHCSCLRVLRLCNLSIIEVTFRENNVPLDNQFPQNLVSLELENTNLTDEDSLSSISELPYLKYLYLKEEAYLGEKWIIHPGTFLELEELTIWHLPNLKEWTVKLATRKNGYVVLPSLRKITLHHCNELPEGLQHVATIEELNIWTTDHIFAKRLKNGTEYYHIIQHFPLVNYGIFPGRATWTMVHGKISDSDSDQKS